MMDPRPFPKLGRHRQLWSSLHEKPELKRLKEHLRLIYKGRARQNVPEFVVDDRNGIRGVIESCLQLPPPETVVVFDMHGQKEEIQLRRDTSGSGYVFSGPMIASIVNGGNGEMELWGYLNQPRAHGVFVLSAGLS